MWAFDLIELNGDDVRRDPLAVRKATLERLLANAAPGVRFNEHLDEEDGPLVFEHACKLGLEGIVSKRRDSVYSSGRSLHWVKSKNPNAPAVRRELEEDWSGRRGYGQKNKARQQNASAFPSCRAIGQQTADHCLSTASLSGVVKVLA